MHEDSDNILRIFIMSSANYLNEIADWKNKIIDEALKEAVGEKTPNNIDDDTKSNAKSPRIDLKIIQMQRY